MGLADIRATRQRTVELALGQPGIDAATAILAELEAEARNELLRQTVPADDVSLHRRTHVLHAGTDTSLEIGFTNLGSMTASFEQAHRSRFGFIDRTRHLSIEAVSVEAAGGDQEAEEPDHAHSLGQPEPSGSWYWRIYHIRRGSGGTGCWKAGDGTSRTIRLMQRMDCAILSGHRRVRPFGLAGGEPDQVGENCVRRANRNMERLAGCDQTVLEAGDAIIIKTPTGG